MQLTTNERTGEERFPIGSWELPVPGGIIRRGEAVSLQEIIEEKGALPCEVKRCERSAVMEVYGLYFCEAHGEECASGALEEIHHDLEQELDRPTNPHVRPLSPHILAALGQGFGVLPKNETYGNGRGDALLLEAWPLDRNRVDSDTLAYVQDPNAPEWRGYSPPFDTFQDDRLTTHRYMRLAFEEDASWIVEALEEKREEMAAQTAYALALEIKAGLVTRLDLS